MDEIDGTALKGSITGTIVAGASLVSGKVGNALSTNGVDQEVRFPKNLDKCFHIPDRCTNGSTFAYSRWLNKSPKLGNVSHKQGEVTPKQWAETRTVSVRLSLKMIFAAIMTYMC